MYHCIWQLNDILSQCTHSVRISHCFTALQHYHHKEKILSEDECKDIGSAGQGWKWKLVFYLSAKSLGYTQEMVKFLEESNFDSYFLNRLKSKLM